MPTHSPASGRRKVRLKHRLIPSPSMATTFYHQGKQWYLWAQKAPDIAGNSNIYLAELENPWTIKGRAGKTQ
ncbi:glycosyl hydrolase [Salmonella enterica subsp. enterica]|uniref:Glycosyl hydrolase n=1 Tax=Salmonella enterica I TaxID=59201 RepID=A0A379WZZ8_SALET|nr:glycosyl hydrolase [Salmonella enterica subsp. enterica]